MFNILLRAGEVVSSVKRDVGMGKFVRTPIGVEAIFMPDGSFVPKKLWYAGKSFEIIRVDRVRKYSPLPPSPVVSQAHSMDTTRSLKSGSIPLLKGDILRICAIELGRRGEQKHNSIFKLSEYFACGDYFNMQKALLWQSFLSFLSTSVIAILKSHLISTFTYSKNTIYRSRFAYNQNEASRQARKEYNQKGRFNL